VQIVIDLGLSACLHFNLGTPESCGDAFGTWPMPDCWNPSWRNA
jgi:hypothetical protein